FAGDPQVYAILAELLAIHLTAAEAELLKRLQGEEFRARFFALVEQGLISLGEQHPMVVLIDDVHWADASSIDLLVRVLPLVKRARVTFIIVTRSRQRPTSLWAKLTSTLDDCRDHVIEILLQSLSTRDSRNLMEGLLGGDYLPEPLAAEILDKSEGN